MLFNFAFNSRSGNFAGVKKILKKEKGNEKGKEKHD